MDRLSRALQKFTNTVRKVAKPPSWLLRPQKQEGQQTEDAAETLAQPEAKSTSDATSEAQSEATSPGAADWLPEGETSISAPPDVPELSLPRPEYGVLLMGGGLLLFLGQSLVPVLLQANRWQGHLITIFGVAFFLLASLGFTKGSLPGWVNKSIGAVSRWLGVNVAQAFMIALAPLFSFAAWLAAGDAVQMRLPLIAVATWILGIALVILGNWRSEHKLSWKPWPWLELVTVVGIFSVAFLLRGLWMDEIPWVLTGDEASAGLNAVDFLNGTRDNIFSIGWYSFPSLYFFIQSLSIRLLGQTIEALRLPSAIAGALTVLGLYWYARNTFGRGIAIASSVYLASFHFHIHFSRIGLNNIWDGLFVILFSGLLWQAWTGGKRISYILAGFIMGLAQYFYTSSRAIFVMVPIWLALAGIKDWTALKKRLPGIASMFLATLTIVFPLALFFFQHPNEFLAPLSRVTILGPWIESEVSHTEGTIWSVLASQFKQSALGFTTMNLRHWYQPGHPMLLPLPASLFLLGLVLLLLSLLELQYLWIGIWLITATLVGGLSQSPPAAQRYIFVAPAVALLVALPVIESGQWLSRLWKSRGRLLSIAMILVLLIAIWNDLAFYFGDYTANRCFGDLNTETATALGYYLAEQEPGLKVYFFAPPRMGYRSHSTIPYLAPDAIGQDVPTPITSPPTGSIEGPTAFIFLVERKEELALVKESYPDGTEFSMWGKDDILLFIAYHVD